jgi:hypothetical protein
MNVPSEGGGLLRRFEQSAAAAHSREITVQSSASAILAAR